MALERFWWGPSLDLLRNSRNGALWLEHCLMTLEAIHVGTLVPGCFNSAGERPDEL